MEKNVYVAPQTTVWTLNLRDGVLAVISQGDPDKKAGAPAWRDMEEEE